MRGSGNEVRLKELLLKFLGKNENELPELKARIMDLNPLKISDDAHFYFEVANFSEKVEEKIEKGNFDLQKEGIFVISLKDWRFKFSRIPNKQSYFFDILVKDFECSKFDFDDNPTCTTSNHNEKNMEDGEEKPNVFHENLENVYEEKKNDFVDLEKNNGKGNNEGDGVDLEKTVVKVEERIHVYEDLDSFGAISVDRNTLSVITKGSNISDKDKFGEERRVKEFKLFSLDNMININNDPQVKISHQRRVGRELETSKMQNIKIYPISPKKKIEFRKNIGDQNSPLQNNSGRKELGNRSTAVSEQSKGFKSEKRKDFEEEVENKKETEQGDSTSKNLMMKFNSDSIKRTISRGLGLSGPNGSNNLQKLIEQRKLRSVLVDSQSSITEHFRQEESHLFGDDDEEYDEDISIIKKKIFEKSKNKDKIEKEEEMMEEEIPDKELMMVEETPMDRKSSEKALHFMKQSTFGCITNTFGNENFFGNEDCYLNKKNIGDEVSFRNSDLMENREEIRFEDLKEIMDKRPDLLKWKEIEFEADVVNCLLDNFEEIRKRFE